MQIGLTGEIILLILLTAIGTMTIINIRLMMHMLNRSSSAEIKTAVERSKKKGYLVPGLGRFTIRDKIKPKRGDDRAAYLAEKKENE